MDPLQECIPPYELVSTTPRTQFDGLHVYALQSAADPIEHETHASEGLEQGFEDANVAPSHERPEPLRGPYEYTRHPRPHQHSFSEGGPASLYSRAIKQRALAAARCGHFLWDHLPIS